MRRVSPMTPAEVEAVSDPVGLAHAISAPANVKRLVEPVLIAALLGRLAGLGRFEDAFQLLQQHSKARRNEVGVEVAGAALVAALASGVPDHLEAALRAYERLMRDPSDLYWVGAMHADAHACAVALGVPERGLALIERLLDHYSPGPKRRELPDHFPIDDPRIADLWTRPAQQSLLPALASMRSRRAPRARR